MLSRISRWCIIAAVVVAVILIVGLTHDFAAGEGQQWFTTRPALVAILLVLGYAFMLVQRWASRRLTAASEPEEEA